MSGTSEERTVFVETACGHGELVTVTDENEQRLRAGYAARRCYSCDLAAETVEELRQGDIKRAKQAVREWADATLTADNVLTQALLNFVSSVAPPSPQPDTDRRRYTWEEGDLDPDGRDAFDIAEEMVEAAVHDLASESWRIQSLTPLVESDHKMDVCVVEDYLIRTREAVARLSLVLAPFLAERQEDLGKLRPGFLTRIYREGLDYARARCEDWLPDEQLVEAWDRIGQGIPGGKK